MQNSELYLQTVNALSNVIGITQYCACKTLKYVSVPLLTLALLAHNINVNFNILSNDKNSMLTQENLGIK